MEIFLTVKNVYGNNLVYPQCITSENLAKFKGVKTFKADDIKLLARLGYKVTWVAQKLQGVA
jgi:hypothetical protein|tara:strand:+ start:153 stop:338 length:186 start_codon:yes stop_codon:yes gene_type:complete